MWGGLLRSFGLKPNYEPLGIWAEAQLRTFYPRSQHGSWERGFGGSASKSCNLGYNSSMVVQFLSRPDAPPAKRFLFFRRCVLFGHLLPPEAVVF